MRGTNQLLLFIYANVAGVGMGLHIYGLTAAFALLALGEVTNAICEAIRGRK